MTFYRDEVLTDSPVVYFTYDDDNLATNSGSRSGVTVTSSGGITYGTGRVVRSPQFAGSGSATRINYNINGNTMFNASPWSIEMWFKVGTFTTGYMDLFQLNDGGNVISAFLDFSSSKKLVVRHRATGGGTLYAINTTYNNADSAWHHMVITRSGTTLTVYVDGSSVGSTTIAATAPTFANTTPFYVGAYGDSAGNENWNGAIDEVAIYPTALSSTRVSAHYAADTTKAGGYTAQAMNASAAMPGGVKQNIISVTATAMTAAVTLPGGQKARYATTSPSVDAYTYSVSPDNVFNGAVVRVGPTATTYIKLDSAPTTYGETALSGTLTLTVQSATGTRGVEFARITQDWDETTLTYNTAPTATVVGTASQSGSTLTYTFDPADYAGGYGLRIRQTTGTADTFFDSSEVSSGTKPKVTWMIRQADSHDLSVAADPMSAIALVNGASVGIAVAPAATAMTATGLLVNPIVAGVRNVTKTAEPVQAFAELVGGGFALEVSVAATPLTASAEASTATVQTTQGVIYNVDALTASGLFKGATLVNSQPIGVNEADDKYYQRVRSNSPSTWLRLNDRGSVAKDRVTGTDYGTYNGVRTGQANGPEGRASVYFDGNDLIDTNEVGDEAGGGPRALEFSFRTTQANAFLMIGEDSARELLATNRSPAIETRLVNGKITMRYWGYGNPDVITAQFSGFRNLADGEWHTVVIRTTSEATPVQTNTGGNLNSGVEIWVDGKFEIRRYGDAAFLGFPDYIGGRPDVIEYASPLPPLPRSEWFTGDMSEIVFYSNPLNKESIPRNYYAFMGWNPIEASPIEAFAFTPDGARGKGNQSRMLYLTWGFGFDFYGGQAFTGNNKPSQSPILADVSTNSIPGQAYGYKVFYKSVISHDNITYRDPVTDEFALMNLESDIDLGDYDVIAFQDWPDEGWELDVIERFVPGGYEKFCGQLADASAKGIGLYITNPRMAVDLGIVDRVEWVPTLRESKYASFQGNAAGLYDYGTAVKFPFNNGASGGVGPTGDQGLPSVVSPQNLDPKYLATKAYFYGDTNKNDRFKVRALIDGLTDIGSYMIEEAVFHVDYDQFGDQNVAYKYLHRPDGLQIGDEYIFHGTDMGLSRQWQDDGDYVPSRSNGTWATPLSNVKTGTVVTTFGAKYWQETSELDNPYKNYATTIVLRPGDKMLGRRITGKVYVNYSEQPNRSPESVRIQLTPADIRETPEQKAWEYSYTRVTSNQSDVTTYTNVAVTGPDGVVTVVPVQNVGSHLVALRTLERYPLRYEASFQMDRRAWFWLLHRPEQEAPGSVTVAATPMEATTSVATPTVVARKSTTVRATPMFALAEMPRIAEQTGGDVAVHALPWEVSAEFTTYIKRTIISATPMTANAELVENFNAVHTTGEQVVLILHGVDATLYIKEED